MIDSDMYLLIDMFLTLAASVRASHICFNTMSPFCDLHDDDLFYPDLSMISTLIHNVFGYRVSLFS